MNALAIGQSKLARRFALIFLGCAFIPTILLLYLSYHQVSAELLGRSIDNLSDETKSYGLSLLDRLVRVRDHLSFIAGEIEKNGIDAANNLEQVADPDTLEIFDSLLLVSDTAPVLVILGASRPLDYVAIRDAYRTAHHPAIIFTERPPAGPDRVFQAYPVQLSGESKGYVVGEVDNDYLWGYGESPLLPEHTSLAVYDERGGGLFATDISPGQAINPYWERSTATNFRRFEYRHDGQRYLAAAWQLFLKSKFDGDTWTIVLSESEAYLLASLGTFQRNLIMAVMLGLLFVLLTTMFFIRRRLEPLKALKSRTEQIARKDFTSEIKVESGDEFEDLAGSFNIMSRELQKQFSALETIDSIDRAILSSLSLPDIINTTLPMIRNFFQCDAIVLGSLRDKSGSEYNGYLHAGTMTEPVTQDFSLDKEQSALLLGKTEPYLWQQETEHLDFIAGLSRQEYETIVSAALRKDDDIMGILVLCHQQERPYDEAELKQLRQLADQVSVALSNSDLVENLENLALGTVEALARTVDAKSEWTSGHSGRVADYAVRIGVAMGMEGKDIELLRRGGLLHDIGKIGTPVSILDKAGKLNVDEFQQMRRHPQAGAKILEPIAVHQDILCMVVQHHERYDGKGYPLGLAGEEIDLHGRIMAVADVFDALRSSRPYREGMPLEEVVGRIVEGSGTHFDPAVVAAFQTIMSEEEAEVPAEMSVAG